MFHLVSLVGIGMLFLVILAFLPEAQNKKVEYRCNLLCAGLLIAIGVMVLNIYIEPMWWDSSRWWAPMDSDTWVGIFRSASLVFSWLFFILQFIPLIRRAWKRQHNGLSLWSFGDQGHNPDPDTSESCGEGGQKVLNGEEVVR